MPVRLVTKPFFESFSLNKHRKSHTGEQSNPDHFMAPAPPSKIRNVVISESVVCTFIQIYKNNNKKKQIFLLLFGV